MKSRRGRPNRATASAKALQGVDTAAVDPEDVLKQVAGDRSAPASARVAAAKALMRAEEDRYVRRINDEQNARMFGRDQ